jgi:DNA-binding transcriptional MerR regulator
MRTAVPHGRFKAGEVGDLAGVSGVAIGQWARWSYISSSVREDEPRVYSLEDVEEARVVGALLRRGVRHAEIRRAVRALRWLDPEARWPLRGARFGTRPGRRGRVNVVLRGPEGDYELTERGWQRLVGVVQVEDL